jgi:CBS domain-containing protein
MNVMEAAKLMLPNSSTILPVVQSNEKRVLIGVVSLLDVFKNLDLDKVPDKQISQIMSTKVVTTSPDDPVTKVWGNMIESDLTGMPVIDGTGKLMGMITRFDILNKGWARISKESSTKPIDSMHMHVGKLMSSPIYSIKQDDSLRTAMEMMRKYDIGRISVVDEGKLVGIVDRYDLIKSYLGEGR